MHRIFFTHLSIYLHFPCFPVVAVFNSAAVNAGVSVSFQIMLFPDIDPGEG